jgi:hypothetical protein
MAFWNRGNPGDLSLPANDRGAGSFGSYRYDLIPANKRVTLRLADSNPYQSELQKIVEAGGDLETAMSRRSVEEERTDAPMIVRLFTGSRVSGVVGVVPRGLESVVDEALSRLDKKGQKVRIPARVVKTRSGLRVDLLMGLTR